MCYINDIANLNDILQNILHSPVYSSISEI